MLLNENYDTHTSLLKYQHFQEAAVFFTGWQHFVDIKGNFANFTG